MRPDLYKGFNPWDRISEPSTLRAVLNEGGVTGPWIMAEAGTHLVASAENWWTMLLGSGYRGTIEQMESKMVEYVRQANFAYIANAQIQEVQVNVVYAVAKKPD